MAKKKIVEKELRVMALCKVRPDVIDGYRGLWEANDIFIYMGEIVNMKGHGIFLLHHSTHEKCGKLYSGFHIDSFIELTDEEM